MCHSYKAINIIKQSDISNHELSIFLNNISKDKMIEIIINDRVIQTNNDIDMLSVNVNKLNVYSR